MTTCLDEVIASLASIATAIGDLEPFAPWVEFVPGVAQGVNVGTDVVYISEYQLINGRLKVQIHATMLNAGTSGEVIRIALPVSPGGLCIVKQVGYGYVRRGTNGLLYGGSVFVSGTNEVAIWSWQPNSIVGTDPAFAVVPGDVLSLSIDTRVV
jgi:hypothetical protein